MIQIKAQYLGNSAGLSSEYWPESVMTASYLINRTPSAALGRLSSLTKLRKNLSIQDRDEYSYLKASKCIVYALDKSIPKSEKMKERAKTEFLVEYNPRKIYRILLLDEEMVIGTRDVLFDKTLFIHNFKNLTPTAEVVSVIDFNMISVIPHFIFDIPDHPIRNNEPESQIIESELQSE